MNEKEKELLKKKAEEKFKQREKDIKDNKEVKK